MSEPLMVVLPADNRLDIFSAPNGLDPYLDKIRAQIDAFSADAATSAGRDEIRRFAYKIAQSRTFLDGEGKKLVDGLKDLPKKVDAERKRMRDTLEAWQEQVRAPLTAWEEAEKARIAKHRDAILVLEYMSKVSWHETTAEAIYALIKDADAVPIDEQCEEFKADYATAKDAGLRHLKTIVLERLAFEEEQAELAQLRTEKEARAAAEREDQIRQEAAERAAREEREKAEAAQKAAEEAAALAQQEAARREAKLQWELGESQRREAAAEQKARDEIEARQRAEEEDAKRREDNKRHCAGINRAAKKALVDNGIAEDVAETVVRLIAQKKIAHISIAY